MSHKKQYSIVLALCAALFGVLAMVSLLLGGTGQYRADAAVPVKQDIVFGDMRYGVGSVLVLPTFTAEGGENDFTLAVDKDGSPLREEAPLSEYGGTFTLDVGGMYSFVFRSESCQFEETAVIYADPALPPIQDFAIKTEYKKGERFQKPEIVFLGEAAGISYDAVLTYPNGAAYTFNAVSLEDAGKYAFTVSGEFKGAAFSYEKQFIVPLDSFETDSASAAHYEEMHAVRQEDGILVDFSNQSDNSFTFNRVIDLREFPRSESFLEFFVCPEVDGTADFTRMVITLTDIYDTENALSIKICAMEAAPAYMPAYIVAGCLPKNQSLAGNEGGTIRNVGLEGVSYGTKYDVLFSDASAGKMNFYFDLNKNALYCSPSDYYLVADFNDVAFFGDNLWDGFTTGEVNMSVTISDFNADGAQLLFTKIGYYDLSEDTYTDKSHVQITADVPDPMPVGFVGEEFPLFEAQAYDYDTKTPLEVRTSVRSGNVYLDCAGGKFVPPYAGQYDIIYSVTDVYGNVFTETRTVEITDSEAPFTLKLDATEATAVSGVAMPLPECRAENNSGPVDVSIRVSGPQEFLHNDLSSILFEKGGDYTLTYEATDYLGREASAVLNVKVADSEEPIFLAQPTFPEFFVSGASYTLDVVDATDYRTGVTAEAEIWLFDAAHPEGVLAENGTFTPSVAKNGDTVTVRYVAEGSVNDGIIEREIPCVLFDPNEIALEQHFLTEGFQTVRVTEDEGLEMVAAPGTESATFRYTNILSPVDLKMEMGVEGDISAIHLFLRDASNRSRYLKVTIREESSGVFAYINDRYDIAYAFSDSFKEDGITVYYSSSTQRLYNHENFSANIKTWQNGDAFEGFPRGIELYGTVDIAGEEGGTFTVVHINGQYFDLAIDLNAPSIVIDGSYGGSFKPGDKVTVNTASSYDVLDAATSVSVTVKYGENYVTAEDGTLLDNAPANKLYTFLIQGYGDYSVEYTSADMYGNSNISQYMLRIGDSVKPEISVTGVPAEAQAGDTISLPEATVSDDVTSPENITVVITCEDAYGRITTVKNGKVTFNRRGAWKITYTASDENSNSSSVVFTVNVL